MITLYGTPPTRALRAIWLLNELGLEYETHPVDLMQGENQQQAFLSLRQEYVEMVTVLERHMKEREYLVGDRQTWPTSTPPMPWAGRTKRTCSVMRRG